MTEWARPVPWRRIRWWQFALAQLVFLALIALLQLLIPDDWEALGAMLVVVGGTAQLWLNASGPLPPPSLPDPAIQSPHQLTPWEIQHLRAKIRRETNTWLDLGYLVSFEALILGGGLVFLVAFLD